jgi:hypothetical protein
MLASPVSLTTTLESTPLVIPEQQVSLFKFYMNHAVQDGMSYGGELYGLAREFTISDRLKAYQFGCKLFEQGIPALISVSKQRYVVWINLRNL